MNWGTLEEQVKIVKNCLKELHDKNLKINLPICYFGEDEIELLGYNYTNCLIRKQVQFQIVKPTNNLKNLRSSLVQSTKFIPNLAKLCYPFRPFFIKQEKFHWRDNLKKHSDKIKAKKAKTIESRHYNPSLEARVRYNASRQGLGAALK